MFTLIITIIKHETQDVVTQCIKNHVVFEKMFDSLLFLKKQNEKKNIYYLVFNVQNKNKKKMSMLTDLFGQNLARVILQFIPRAQYDHWMCHKVVSRDQFVLHELFVDRQENDRLRCILRRQFTQTLTQKVPSNSCSVALMLYGSEQQCLCLLKYMESKEYEQAIIACVQSNNISVERLLYLSIQCAFPFSHVARFCTFDIVHKVFRHRSSVYRDVTLFTLVFHALAEHGCVDVAVPLWIVQFVDVFLDPQRLANLFRRCIPASISLHTLEYIVTKKPPPFVMDAIFEGLVKSGRIEDAAAIYNHLTTKPQLMYDVCFTRNGAFSFDLKCMELLFQYVLNQKLSVEMQLPSQQWSDMTLCDAIMDAYRGVVVDPIPDFAFASMNGHDAFAILIWRYNPIPFQLLPFVDLQHKCRLSTFFTSLWCDIEPLVQQSPLAFAMLAIRSNNTTLWQLMNSHDLIPSSSEFRLIVSLSIPSCLSTDLLSHLDPSCFDNNFQDLIRLSLSTKNVKVVTTLLSRWQNPSQQFLKQHVLEFVTHGIVLAVDMILAADDIAPRTLTQCYHHALDHLDMMKSLWRLCPLTKESLTSEECAYVTKKLTSLNRNDDVFCFLAQKQFMAMEIWQAYDETERLNILAKIDFDIDFTKEQTPCFS